VLEEGSPSISSKYQSKYQSNYQLGMTIRRPSPSGRNIFRDSIICAVINHKEPLPRGAGACVDTLEHAGTSIDWLRERISFR